MILKTIPNTPSPLERVGVRLFQFWPRYFIHMRPYLLFVSGIAGLAGIAMFPTSSIYSLPFWLTFLPCFFGYGFGQALTDCFQIDTDTISAPYRPLSKKEIWLISVGLVSLLGLLLIGCSLIYLNPNNILWSILTVTGLASYSYFKKHFWWAGPFYNGWIVVLLPIMAYQCMQLIGWIDISNPNIIALLILTFFSYANFVLIGYLKDISADKATGYKTFPVVFGWDATVLIGDIFALISIGSCYFIFNGEFKWQSILFFTAASIIAICGQVFAHFTKNKTEENSAIPVISTVRSFILWHTAIIVQMKPQWFLFVCLFYILFEIVLYFRPMKHQI